MAITVHHVSLLYLLEPSGFTGLMPCINPDPVLYGRNRITSTVQRRLPPRPFRRHWRMAILQPMNKSETATSPPTTTALRERLKRRAAEFAREEIATRTDLRDHTVIPRELWQAVGSAGLAEIALPAEYGGAGGDLRALVMASQAMAEIGGNLGLVTSWMGCQWRSKKGPPRRCKKGPLGGCGLVPVVHGRAPRATRRALNRLTRRRAREGPVGPRGQAWAGWSVQLAVGV